MYPLLNEKVLPFLKEAFVLYIKVTINFNYYAIWTRVGYAFFLFSFIYRFLGANAVSEMTPTQLICFYYLFALVFVLATTPMFFLYRPLGDFLYHQLTRDYMVSRIGNTPGVIAGWMAAMGGGVIAGGGALAFASNNGSWWLRTNMENKTYQTDLQQINERWELRQSNASVFESEKKRANAYQSNMQSFDQEVKEATTLSCCKKRWPFLGRSMKRGCAQ